MAVDKRGHVWVVQRPRSLSERELGAQQKPPFSKCCVAAPPVLVFDQAGDRRALVGRAGPGLRVAGERARRLRGRRRQRLAGRQRRQGRAAAEVHARRQVPAADRPQRPVQGQQRHRQPGQPGRHPRGHGGARSVRGRRLSQSPHHRVRLADRRLQAALGRLRQAAERRQDAALRSGAAAGAAVRQPGALRALFQRRAGLRLRPHQQPRAGVPQGRHVRVRGRVREGHAPERLGVGAGVLARRRPAVHLHGGRREQRAAHHRSRQQRGAGRGSAGPAVTPASFTSSTTSPSIATAISIRPRSTPGSGCRSSGGCPLPRPAECGRDLYSGRWRKP